MILDELIERIKQYSPKELSAPQGYTLPISHEGIGPLSRDDLLKIVEVAALSIAVCEDQTRIAIADPTPDSTYDRMIRKARELNLEHEAEVLEQYKPRSDLRVPFFGMSRGAELEIAVKSLIASNHFTSQSRTDSRDIDLWFGYYRTSEALTIALSTFFSQANPSKDPVDEIFRVSMGDKRAMNSAMVTHACIPELGIAAESTQIGSYAGTAIYSAILNSPSFRGDRMKISSDSAVHLLIGDAGINEPGFPSAMRSLETQIAAYAARRLGLSDAQIYAASLDIDKQRKLIGNALKSGRFRLEVDVLNNLVGISTRSTFMHPFGDVLSDFSYLESIGAAKTVRYETIDFLKLLESQVNINHELRQGTGIVGVETRGRRPGGHTQSNFYGQGLIRIPDEMEIPNRLTLENISEVMNVNRGKFPQGPVSGLSWLDCVYHNNYEPLEDALHVLIDLDYVSKDGAVSMLERAQSRSLQSIARIFETHEKKTSYTQIKPSQGDDDVENQWRVIAQSYDVQQRRNQTLKVHIPLLEKEMQFKNIRPDDIKAGEIVYPEQFGNVDPLTAENLAILEMLIAKGELRGTGQDIHSSNPQDISALLRGSMREMGGINKATAMIQATMEKLNPGKGRYHFGDTVGINEEGILQFCLAAGLLFQDTGAVFGEIQFFDYLSQVFGMDNIGTAFQRSNGQEKLPIIVRSTFGFFRYGNMEALFREDGAGGMYHAATNLNKILTSYPGWNVEVPNTSRDIVMAYRRALATSTPTFVLLSAPVMRALQIGGFNYSTNYPTFDEIDSFGMLHAHPQKENETALPIDRHEDIILTYGEYVPICYAVAEKIKSERGKNVLVVDYSTLEPRDRNLAGKLLEHYSTPSNVTFTIVSAEDSSGFGSTILSDLVDAKIPIERINRLSRIEKTWPAWRESHLIHPNPQAIYDAVVKK